ncbi:uncharacterized protein RAG0_01573 [Rhynchosporium agropyri]|uniref:Uncharacterized protein n=3 Tax=Rhynchosporium TaxID=38037 RepID=A0A1E1M7S7_RHYSE|nr:uncharacterized protein RAG0_01573 [Rhynchosporium agropyri]CZT13099.1 uncharacterized protein RCO7_04229 [Rhynchosporium commune]CZT45150.1 uncharacterized protein RSE6_05434 [Rhynchosporium secalis]
MTLEHAPASLGCKSATPTPSLLLNQQPWTATALALPVASEPVISKGDFATQLELARCLTKREAAPEPEPQSAVVNYYTDCSAGCVKAENVRGGICDAAGACTCYE